MFGLSLVKLVAIGIVAALVIGPERVPQFAARLAQLVRSLRRLAEDATGRIREELGPEFDDVDWKRLDPRQYDPRRIIRDALLDDLDSDPGPVEKAPVVHISRPTPPTQGADEPPL